jgi:hypothetical protein
VHNEGAPGTDMYLGCLPPESLFGSFSFSGMSFSPDPGFLNYEYGDLSIVTRVI